MSDPNIPAVAEYPARQPPAVGTTRSFCIRLWQHMRLEANGEARVCCAYQGENIAQDGVSLSARSRSLMDIWNADTLRELRRDMVAGRHIAGCRPCYTVEARGGISMRMNDNTAWEQDWYNERPATIDQMAALAVGNDFRLPKLPEMIEVETGNLCNLKCRMCNGFSSSRIAKDVVHRKWDGLQYARYDDPEVLINPGKIRRVGPIEGLFDELAKDTGSPVRLLYFLGGEPFLVREIPRLLERLAAVGRSQFLSLTFISNGSVVPQWLSLAAQFRRFHLTISVDGYAEQYDYIRYPGRWSKLAHNLELFKKIPNVYPHVTITVQVNNALGLTRLFRYLDSVEIGFTGYLLHSPAHLAVSALPASIRRLAAARLTEYAEADCRSEHRALVLSFAAQFQVGDDAGDPARLRDFMLFTNDLDASRGQSIHRTDPELVELLEQAGFRWLHETLHAPGVPVKLPPELSATTQLLPDELPRSRQAQQPSEQQVAPVEGGLKRVRHEPAKVYASRVWRLTRPLRAAGSRLRRWLRGGRSPAQPEPQ
jgi:hypothetical protein